jgi:hypothetical protein
LAVADDVVVASLLRVLRLRLPMQMVALNLAGRERARDVQ